ncbi:hypothetical protein Tco_1376197 [Tanacetum coccineum]
MPSYNWLERPGALHSPKGCDDTAKDSVWQVRLSFSRSLWVNWETENNPRTIEETLILVSLLVLRALLVPMKGQCEVILFPMASFKLSVIRYILAIPRPIEYELVHSPSFVSSSCLFLRHEQSRHRKANLETTSLKIFIEFLRFGSLSFSLRLSSFPLMMEMELDGFKELKLTTGATTGQHWAQDLD